jgi:4'-phosphopantetheinyl transferase
MANEPEVRVRRAEAPGLWWALTGLDEWIRHRERLVAALSRREIERAGRFANDALRCRYEIGRGLLRELLGRSIGVAADQVRLCETDRGRPAIEGRGEELDFNATHSGDLWAVALGRGVRVGIDIEGVGRTRETLALAERFFTGTEAAYLRGIDGERERGRAFLELWTAKEAVLKGSGEGISGGLASFDLTDWVMGRADRVRYGEGVWRLYRGEVPEGAVLTIAGQKRGGGELEMTAPERIEIG